MDEVRSSRLRLLLRVAEALQPLDDLLRARRHVAIPDTPGGRPLMLAYLVILLEWPDTAVPKKVADGFEIAGDIAPSGILRPIDARPSVSDST